MVTLGALMEKIDLSSNTRKHRRFRIERVAKIKQTRKQKCTRGEFLRRIALEARGYRNARRRITLKPVFASWRCQLWCC